MVTLAHSILSLVLYVVIQTVTSIHPSLNHRIKEQLCARQTTQIVRKNLLVALKKIKILLSEWNEYLHQSCETQL